ncbi:hypothetical protein PORCAN_345 [Porphyromonas crevioricanis JCM 13913]|nr:hypothetical protein PORCAN_345 [Porphyromonas crevioricanis JCM 13913]
MLTQEKKFALTGENFCSLPCQQKMSPVTSQKGVEKHRLRPPYLNRKGSM